MSGSIYALGPAAPLALLPDHAGIWLREARATAALAVPLIGAQMTAMGMGVTDVLMAGHLGAHLLGTVAVASALYNIGNMFAVGVNAALAPTVAQLEGSGAREQIGPMFRQALIVSFAVGVLLMLAMYFGGPRLAAALGFADALVADIDSFLRTIAFALPAVSLFYCCRGLSEGLSMPRPTLVIAAIGLLVLAALDYLLMYAPLGNTPLGAHGCAMATVAACWVQTALFALWLRFSGRYCGLGWGSGPRGIQPRAILALLRTGMPMAISLLMESGMFSAAGVAVGRFGEVAAACHQVALNIEGFSFMVPLGIAIATSIRVGNAAGRADPQAVRRAGFSGIGLSLTMQCLSSSLMLTVPHVFTGLFTEDPAVIAGGAMLLRIAGVFQIADGLQSSAMGALRGLKDTRVPMMITGFSYWIIGFPAALLLAFVLDWQARGMWCGLIVGLTVSAALLAPRFVALSGRPVPTGLAALRT